MHGHWFCTEPTRTSSHSGCQKLLVLEKELPPRGWKITRATRVSWGGLLFDLIPWHFYRSSLCHDVLPHQTLGEAGLDKHGYEQIDIKSCYVRSDWKTWSGSMAVFTSLSFVELFLKLWFLSIRAFFLLSFPKKFHTLFKSSQIPYIHFAFSIFYYSLSSLTTAILISQSKTLILLMSTSPNSCRGSRVTRYMEVQMPSKQHLRDVRFLAFSFGMSHETWRICWAHTLANLTDPASRISDSVD